MKKAILFLVCCMTIISAQAQRMTRNYRDVSIAEALRQLAEESRDYTIYFLYNELEDFTITTHVKNKPVPEAIRQMIGFYPIRMTQGEKGEIYVECIHKTDHHVKGLVVDENNLPLPYANVTLLNPADSTMVGGGVTNESGRFVIPNDHGKVIARITYVGYKTAYRLCSRDNIGTIKMQPDQFALGNITIEGSRIHHDATGYTINLRSSDIVKGKQTSDALTFLPGISKEDNSYKINGLTVSEIYVDGVKLTSKDELKNIPADMIDKVKVNYLAGVKQNAADAGGTIEITLLRPSQGGYYGSLSGGTRYQFGKNGIDDENLGGVIYYRHKNLNIYDNLSLHWFQYQETAKQSILNQATDQLTAMDEKQKINGHNFRNRLSLTQQLSDKSSLGASYFIQSFKNRVYTVDKGESGVSWVDTRNNVMDQEVTLKYNTVLGQRETALEMIGDYYNRESRSKSNYVYNQNPSSISEDKTSLNMYKFSVDLAVPRSKKLIWNCGASVRYITSEYTPAFGAVEGTDRFQTSLIPTRTSGMTPLAYASAKGQIWKIQYSAGANFQLNKIQYKTLDDGLTSSNTQWGINPTVQIMMPLDSKGKHSLMLSYKRTLGDIPYSAISSTIRWTDAYNYTVGNPDLKAQRADMVLAGVSLFSNLLNLNAMYARIKNSIHWETRQSSASSDLFYTAFVNLPAQNAYYVSAEVNWNPVKPWTMKLSGRLGIECEDVTIGGVYYKNTRLRPYYLMYNNFNFQHGWGGMLNFFCEPTFKSYDRTFFTVWEVWGQVYKSMCKDQLQLSLSFCALGDRRKYDKQANGFKVTYDYTTPVQSIELSLRWKFSGGKSHDFNVLKNGSQHYDEIVSPH
ncbi:MAG: outer membrane beta-barrel protein [Muribaculaceae bacterium]|nr:outer membrane beta-barrel protein [Muribaculaceae bacterium]